MYIEINNTVIKMVVTICYYIKFHSISPFIMYICFLSLILKDQLDIFLDQDIHNSSISSSFKKEVIYFSPRANLY